MLIRLLAPFTLLLSKTPLATRCGLFRVTFCGSLLDRDRQKVLRALVERLTDALCYTAKWIKSSSRHFVYKGKEGYMLQDT
jgi:hypothetical protein